MLQLQCGWFVDHDSGKTIGSVSICFFKVSVRNWPCIPNSEFSGGKRGRKILNFPIILDFRKTSNPTHIRSSCELHGIIVHSLHDRRIGCHASKSKNILP